MMEGVKGEVVVPVVHLNGTSKEQLAGDRLVVYEALNGAYKLMKKMAPNGRDYYPVPGLMDKAVEQHQRRLRALNRIMDELEVELDALV